MADNAGSSRKGKATEHLIGAMCVLGSGGEMNALTALVDDEGVDLSLKRRDGTRTLDVQVKAGFIDERKKLRDEGILIADVRKETFNPRDDLTMLYVVVNGEEADVKTAWVVPSVELAEKGFTVSTGGKQMVRFQASIKPESKDKWVHRRVNRLGMVKTLLETVRALDDAAP